MASSVREHADKTVEETTDAGECPECDGQIVADGSEDVCQDCGLVVDDTDLDLGPDWKPEHWGDRAGNVQRANGGATKPSMHDKDLGSQVGYENVDATKFNPHADLHVRLGRANKRLRASVGGGSYRYAFCEINRIAEGIDLPSVAHERATELLRKGLEGPLSQCNDIDALVAAAVLVASRECQFGRTLADVDEVSRASNQTTRSMQRRIMREIDGVRCPPPRPEVALRRLACDVDVDDEHRQRAEVLLEDAIDAELHVGRDPSAVAAAALYAASRELGLGYDQTEISDTANISVMTLRTHWQRYRDGEVESFA